MKPLRRRPIRRLDLGLPLVLEVGKHGQCHDDASKKVTTPTGIAVISFTQGFCLGPTIDPRAHRIHAEKSWLWHTDEERRAKSVKGGAGSIVHRLATTERGWTVSIQPTAAWPATDTATVLSDRCG
jgi:hypothetical protein